MTNILKFVKIPLKEILLVVKMVWRRERQLNGLEQ